WTSVSVAPTSWSTTPASIPSPASTSWITSCGGGPSRSTSTRISTAP
ncbi:MAG: 3-oxoacyl-[acyl-carrier protein] reductase, partial [uncultured Rubrobacteraceae bacterium]